MKSIKIFSESQIILLRSINPLLNQYMVPRDLLLHIYFILQDDVLGKYGFVIILLDPVIDDIRELEDALNLYPIKAERLGEPERQKVEDIGGEAAQEKEWYLAKMFIEATESHVYIFYFMMRDLLYKQYLELNL